MNNKDDETKRIPVVKGSEPDREEKENSASPVRGFDPSKAMFVPSDKNASPVPAKKPENSDENTGKPEVKTSIKKADNEYTMATPVVSSEVKPEFIPKADMESTSEIPVISPKKDNNSSQKSDKPEKTLAFYNPDDENKPEQKSPEKPAEQKKTEPAFQKDESRGGKKTHKWLYALLISIASIVLCIAVVISYVFPKIIEDGGMAILHNVSAVVGEPPKNVNVLLVGTDKDGYRTDPIMVATYDNDTQSVHVMQIPRDTYVKGNGRIDKKINSAYFSGIDTLKDEIFKAFGIEIHRYLAVELNGFVEIIDAIGGVEVDVPINMHYDDPVQDLHIHINKGLQVLDGKDAEGFVRYRKGNDGSSYPLGDIDRMKAQKQFVQNTVAKLVSIDGISKIPELLGIAKDNIETDISTAEATSYATKILSLNSDSINFYTAPGVPLYKYGGWYYFIDGQENRTLVMNHFNGEHNKKSYSPVYFDLTADPYDSQAASSSSTGSSSADISDDERYSYYSPENDMGYYDDETDGTNVPVIDDDSIIGNSDENDDYAVDEDSQTGTSQTPSDTSLEKPSNRPSSSGTSSQTKPKQEKPSQSNNPTSTKPDSSTGSASTAPDTDDAPAVQTPQKPVESLPSDAPQIDFD